MDITLTYAGWFAQDSPLEEAGFEPSVPEGIKTSQDGW